MLVGAVGTGLDFFVFFFEREISLRESIRSCLSWIVSFISEVLTQCFLREAGFSRGVKGLLGQAVHVLKEGEERTLAVSRLDELADHVDGLSSSLALRLSLSKKVLVGMTGCPDPVNDLQRCAVPHSFPIFPRNFLSTCPSTFWTWTDEDPISLPGNVLYNL